jgi:hypothetical protein
MPKNLEHDLQIQRLMDGELSRPEIQQLLRTANSQPGIVASRYSPRGWRHAWLNGETDFRLAKHRTLVVRRCDDALRGRARLSGRTRSGIKLKSTRNKSRRQFSRWQCEQRS